MVPQASQESQVPLGMMGYLVLQVQKDPGGCLVSQVFPEKEESLVQRDVLAQRENPERRACLAFPETGE